jgi:SEC-C motif-containing protein
VNIEAMAETQLCPCGSELKLVDCCLPHIQGKSKPSTAEGLLRARYTAFTRGDVDYILNTHHPRTRGDVKREEIEEWSKNSDWLGLKILQKEAGQAGDDTGTIVFHARYETDGKAQDHYEHAQFEKDQGVWMFLDAQGLKPGPIKRTEPKIGRNDPCHCGSGKKFKKCHGA